MFNQMTFNQVPFNIPATSDTYAEAHAVIETSAEATASAEYSASGIAIITTEAVAIPVVEKFATGTAEAQTSAVATATRERISSAIAEIISDAEAAAIVHIIQKMQFNGSLSPGSRLIIDSHRLTAVANGTNVLDKLDGDFIALLPGDNIISLSIPGQAVRLRIDYRDKFV